MPADGDRFEQEFENQDQRLAAWFGDDAWPRVRNFAALLRRHGVERGLIGPREASRLWTRHVLNSAALAQFLPARGVVADVGSGGGLPGVVLAAMRPDLRVYLIEPMQRRVQWLTEVRDALDLRNVVVHGARAEDMVGEVTADVVTARAVAPLQRLAPMALPLVAPGGRMIALKGRRATEELEDSEAVLRRLGARRWRVELIDILGLGDPTYVVEVVLADPDHVIGRR
jgi:16S rRNA (guanine527-N7)-methyltransferase